MNLSPHPVSPGYRPAGGGASPGSGRSFARALMPAFSVAVAYVLAVPAALATFGWMDYHAWWYDKWMLLGVHCLIGLFIGLIRAADGQFREWLWHRAAHAFAGGVLFVLFFTAFGSWKHAFWRWGWFVWDRTFADWDRWLHFGKLPHEWLEHVIAAPGALRLFDWLYFAWGLIMAGTLSAVLWAAPVERCRQYVLTFLGTWILIGSVLAPLLGSVGPVFYSQLVTDPDPYSRLLSGIQGTQSAEVQALLWRATNMPGFIPATGISAMPSVHIAQATLIALLAWTSRCWAFRALGILFAVGMQIATVVLAWHYAIDGYVAAVLTWGMWRVTRPDSRLSPLPSLDGTTAVNLR